MPGTSFYLAEDYHQKYLLQTNSVLFRDISRIYADYKDLLNSTAAARLNGYEAGYGDGDTARAQLDRLGLSVEGRQELQEIIERGLRPACPAP